MVSRSVIRLLVAIALVSPSLLAPAWAAGVRHMLTRSEDGKAVCRAFPSRERGAAPAAVSRRSGDRVLHSSAGSTWDVEYVGFTPEALAAFQRAVEIWAEVIASPVTIRVYATFEPLGEDWLGAAGPWNFQRLPQHPNPLIRLSYLPSALHDSLTGVDAEPGAPDIEATFNRDFDGWYFGLDGRPAFEQYDFVSVVLHELGHGLGFVSSVDVYDSNQGPRIEWGLDDQGTPVPFDLLIKDGLDRWLVDEDIENGSPELAAAVTSRHVFFHARFAVEAGRGQIPELYSPTVWEPGSSISHLDEFLYDFGSRDGLMTPYLYNGEFQHQPGPVALGMMRDIGWKIQDSLQFAQFADGAGIQSDVVLTNPSRTEPATGKVTFYSLTGQILDGADFLVNPSQSNFVIPPLGTLTIPTLGGGSVLYQGSAVVNSDLPLFGVIRFDLPGTGVAGVGSSQSGRAFALPVRRQGNLRTGVAIRNPVPRQVRVQVRLLGADGSPVESKEVLIPGLGRVSQFIDELFSAPQAGNFAGTLEVECAEGEVAVLGLELEVSKRFTTLPVTPLRE